MARALFAGFYALFAVAEGSQFRGFPSQAPITSFGSAGPYKQTLHNYDNVQYYADFVIGGQEVAGIFDTGSFELLVRSTRCRECVHPTPPYNSNLSSSYVMNGTFTKHVFGSGPCVSMMGYDTVSVGPLEAKGQMFWEITDHHIPVLDTARFAAIVGIGPNFAYDHKQDTLLMSYGIETFSICLQKESGSPGYLTWGATLSDETLQRDAAKANVIGKHHWVARMSNVSFLSTPNSSTVDACSEIACAAVIDSGTSLIAAPGQALMQLSEQLPPIKEDCSNLHELPTLRFVLDGTVLELPPQAYVMKVTETEEEEINDIWDLLFFKPKVRKVNQCMPAFMQMDMMSRNGPLWILGMPFFRYYHTTFDRRNTAMFFSTAGPKCEPLPFKRHNATASLIAEGSKLDAPMEVKLSAMISPQLSGMIDFPFGNGGELEL